MKHFEDLDKLSNLTYLPDIYKALREANIQLERIADALEDANMEDKN